jgi:hypothetical protein
MTYYCTTCGSRRTAEQTFCTACGGKLPTASTRQGTGAPATVKQPAVASSHIEPDARVARSAIATDTRIPPAAALVAPSPASRPGRRRSKAWIYYTVLAGGSLIELCAGHIAGMAGMALFGLYARYLYRGGRIVLWIW